MALRLNFTCLVILPLLLASCAPSHCESGRSAAGGAASSVSAVKLTALEAKIVAAARTQVGVSYTQQYFSISYPNGDVPRNVGACTDVVIRALRGGGYDLQRLMHNDMRRNFNRYPTKWGLRRPDRNIDHRRVPNQMTFMRRFGQAVTTKVSSATLAQWRPGDIVYWKFDNGLDHCGIISDHRTAQGLPLVIHNVGGGREEDALLAWKITGHFRYPRR